MIEIMEETGVFQ